MPAKSTKEHVLRRFHETHGDRYDYSLVCYTNSGTHVQVICREHGVFETTPDNHYRGNGCPECSKKNLGVANRIPIEDIKKRLVDAQGLRYIYLLDAYTLSTELRYLCPTHGWRTQSVHSLLPVGCSLCRREISAAKAMAEGTFEGLTEALTCDLSTGRLYSKKPVRGRLAGAEVPYGRDRHGYLMVCLGKKSIPVHRVVLAFSLGRLPEAGKSCDHINGVITDNRAVNLREVDHQQNLCNRRLNVNSTTRVNGVNYSKRDGKYRARVTHNGKEKYLGTFVSLEAAALARAEADKELGFHPNHGLPAEARAKTT